MENEIIIVNNWRLLDIQAGAIFDRADEDGPGYAPPIDWGKDLSGDEFEIVDAKDYDYRPDYDEETETFWEWVNSFVDTESILTKTIRGK